MFRNIAIAVMLCAFVAPAMGQTVEQLQKELEEVKKERDKLRIELAQIKLKLASLESKQPKEGETTADAGSSDTTTATSDEDDDDVDDSGVARNVRLWEVRMESKKRLDAGDIRSQINQEKSTLGGVRKQIDTINKRLAEMNRENERWENYYKSKTNKKKPHQEDAFGKLRAQVKGLEARERAGNVRITKLEREATEAQNTMVANVTRLSDSQLMKVYGQGTMKDTVDAMEIGKTYIVEGRKGGIDVIIPSKIAVKE